MGGGSSSCLSQENTTSRDVPFAWWEAVSPLSHGVSPATVGGSCAIV